MARLRKRRSRRGGLIPDVEGLMGELHIKRWDVGHTNNGHCRLTLTAYGQTRKYFFAATPSDKRSRLNTLAGIKRLVRQLRDDHLRAASSRTD